jgi:SAM-dependent methyltransferase
MPVGASKYRPFFPIAVPNQDFCQYQGTAVRYLEPIDYVCDITRIPLPDGSLDAIVCTEVFEHVVNPMAVLAEFSRLLKPGGRLFLTAPMLSHLHMAPYHFYGGFTHYWYQHWLPLSGLKIDELIAVGGPDAVAGVRGELTWPGKARRRTSPCSRNGCPIRQNALQIASPLRSLDAACLIDDRQRFGLFKLPRFATKG